MCGIAGVWSANPIAHPEALIERLDRALAHRGPDGRGASMHDEGRLVLVHRRLAIIEPSPAGQQPMSTADGRYTIIFNGEIYNHHELRSALEGRGVRLRTRSDTEVLLSLVSASGPSALSEVRGMFAFALWDNLDRELLLARDRFGIKPLYVSARNTGIAFASEIRTLLESGHCARDVNPAGVLAYLRWGAIPGPLTWLRDVRALEPGTWMKWQADGSSRAGRYADARALWAHENRRQLSSSDWHDRTRAALEESVRVHLVADVPVGCFLSGGIDSGALVSSAAAARAGLHTFTVAFDEDAHSEEGFARIVAEKFGTTHHTLHVDPGTLLRQWPSIAAHMDQPTIDGVNSYLVSQAVAAAGVKAVLSGIGGDELFGGYPSFTRVPLGARLRMIPRRLRRMGTQLAARPSSWRTHKLQHAADHAHSVFELYRAVRGWIMPSELTTLAGPALADAVIPACVDSVEQQFAGVDTHGCIPARVAQLETTMYLRQQLLRDADVMSMAHGLELRVPFVDHELIGALWPELGSHPELLRGKRLLVESLRYPLPDSIVSRPKQGFTLPFGTWIDGPLSDFVASGLALASDGGWLAPSAPAQVLRSWHSRRCHWSRPWGLAVLGHFLHG